VILFGSFARRDINEGSDVDIVVIADFKEQFLGGSNFSSTSTMASVSPLSL